MLVQESVETVRRVPSRRRVWGARVIVGLAGVFAVGTAVRVGGLERGVFLVPMVAFTPCFAVAAVVVLAIAAVARNRVAIAIMLVVCSCLAWCVAPRAVSSATAGQPWGMSAATGQPGETSADGQASETSADGEASGASAAGRASGADADGRVLRVLTANLNGGRGDAAVIVDLVRRLDVDVLSLQEVTWSAQERLTAAGLGALMPYQISEPEFRGPEGSGVYARHPLRARTGLFEPVGHHMPVAEVALPGGSAVEVVVVHPVAPVPSTVPEWEAGVATLPPAPATGPPRILAGDFNATLDHAVFRGLLSTGYTDAAAATGQGLVPTWPKGRGLPPLVAIDHVLTDARARAAAVHVYDLPGSDHRALFADLRVQP
ncbi:endonuclease/exonuclease/phosphatase family protein [Nonomuraea sp. K274]|uniref:Endonuclease/exonuclease/phosphatase family protein n=1 Tax=Nonomuraea cypriaca TaxID=1187855 RepID=A0A931AGW3_9ACTN|nr:endonuclease/exonuclease/phosphatase family protein [Nonomuraea cypriaca]MBF8191415.1 endonuclease/exonuclease/phosphatase family protein [Nonomuraea cypriaca]